MSGMNRATAADQTRLTSTIVLACHIPIHCFTQQRSTISAHPILPVHRRTPIKRRQETPIQIQSASRGYGRWLTWRVKRAKMNLQICLRMLAIHIIHRRVKSFHRSLLAGFIRCIIHICGRSCTETSTVQQPRTWLGIHTKLQFSSLINEPSALHWHTMAFH